MSFFGRELRAGRRYFPCAVAVLVLIEPCASERRDAWNAFVTEHPRTSFYHRYEWADVNDSCFGHRSCYLAAWQGDRIVGVFPFVQVKSSLFGNIACSLPFVNFGGPCGENDEIEHQLIREAESIVGTWSADYLEIRSRVSMTVDLCPGVDALWTGFKTGHRQDIRRGYKCGLTVKFGGVELVRDFYTVLSEAWRDIGTPVYARSYIETVARTFSEQIRLCVVYDGKVPAVASLQAYDRGTAEGLWLGTRARYRHQLAGYVLYWEILKDAALHNCGQFHLGRSTARSGAETFKKKWNAYPTQLYWQYVLRNRREIPRLNPQNPRYRMAIGLWRKLPVRLTQLVGPPLARGLP